MLFITKLVSATVKQEINTVVKNPYFKFSVNNITLSTLGEFFLKKIKNNIKVNAIFLYFLIKKVFSIKKDETANYNKNISLITFLAIKNKEDCRFQ